MKIKLLIATLLSFCTFNLGTMYVVPAIVAVNQKEVECLAKNVYHEARGEPIRGQFAVAAVTVNRVRDGRFSPSVCKVVYAKGQFSWVDLLKNHTPKHKEAYEQAKYVALVTLNGSAKDPTNGALWYHADYVKPKWRHYVSKTIQIGSHIFYQ